MSCSRGNEPGVLVEHPWANYVKALELLCKHSSKDYHKAAITRADEFLKVMTGKKQTSTIVLIKAYQTMLPGTVRNRDQLLAQFFYVEDRISSFTTTVTVSLP